MDEKRWRICKLLCDCVGCVALVIYIIVTAVDINNYLVAIRALVAGIAAISYVIKMGVVEIVYGEECKYCILIICICLYDIVRCYV